MVIYKTKLVTMDGFEHTRRGFMRRLGLTLGATIVAGSAEIRASVLETKEELGITTEQYEFMKQYEAWMDEFIEVIRRQKTHPLDVPNNKKIVDLSKQAKGWQKQLVGFMKDDNFARHYMAATERMTKEIPY